MSEALGAEQRAARLARCYDLDTLDISYDAELYVELAHQAGGPVLELAVGSGRLAVPLALAGHRVVGIDTDRAMLERGRAAWRAARGTADPAMLTFVEGDFLSFRSDDRFALTFLAVNTFLLARDDEERLAVLATMREHLVAGGIAAIELSTPDEEELARYDGRLQLEWLRSDPETHESVTKLISARWQPDDGQVELTQVYEWTAAAGGTVSRVAKVDRLHLVSADHLAELARRAGFGSVELRGDHLTTPYGVGSHRLILVARLV